MLDVKFTQPYFAIQLREMWEGDEFDGHELPKINWHCFCKYIKPHTHIHKKSNGRMLVCWYLWLNAHCKIFYRERERMRLDSVSGAAYFAKVINRDGNLSVTNLRILWPLHISFFLLSFPFWKLFINSYHHHAMGLIVLLFFFFHFRKI